MLPISSYTFLQKLSTLPFVEEIWLFGSRARGTNQQRADIDLAIICPQANDTEWSEIIHIIENADTLLHIDCIRFDGLKENDFKNEILKDKKVLYKKKHP